MNEEQLAIANLTNLTALWSDLGATRIGVSADSQVWVSDSWPHRCWSPVKAADGLTGSPLPSPCVVRELPPRAIVPVWQSGGDTRRYEDTLESFGFELGFEQTAMYVSLDGYPEATLLADSDRVLAQAQTDSDLVTWSQISGAAFGYEIDPVPVKRLATSPRASLFLLQVEGKPAGTAMVFQTGPVAGIHQVGVVPEFQGRGLARWMMDVVIESARRQGAQVVTLQASVAGRGLYERMGFTSQFPINNYRRLTADSAKA